MTNSLPWKISMLLIGKPSINGSFPIAMSNNQRVIRYMTPIYPHVRPNRKPRITKVDFQAHSQSFVHKPGFPWLVSPPELCCPIDRWVIYNPTEASNQCNSHDSPSIHRIQHPSIQWPFQEPKLEVPTGLYKAYVREYPHKIWPYMVQNLHFRILKFPLINGSDSKLRFPILHRPTWPWQRTRAHPSARETETVDAAAMARTLC